MLQQTQVATVIPYFDRWMARFPTVAHLAAAVEDDVLHAWQGLGYYRRARNLLLGARTVVERFGGRVPDTVAALKSLPGVGDYTAGAIASIAYNRSAPIVDGNVERVLTRIFALHGDPKKAPLRNRIWELAEALIPDGHANEFNPALMELGATVCTPANPRCQVCPVEAACQARAQDIQGELPETAARPKPTSVPMAAAVVQKGAHVLLVQRRPDEARWPLMWQFPNLELCVDEAAPTGAVRAVREAVGLVGEAGGRMALVRHGVTRYRITLEAFQVSLIEPSSAPKPIGCHDFRWVSPAASRELAMPAAHRKIAERLDAGGASQMELLLVEEGDND